MKNLKDKINIFREAGDAVSVYPYNIMTHPAWMRVYYGVNNVLTTVTTNIRRAIYEES